MQDALTYDVPLVSTRYAERFLKFLKTKRISEEVITAHSASAKSLMTKPDSYLSVNQVIPLLETAQWLLNDEQAAFEFGQQLDLGSHGLFGYMLISRENHSQLIETVVKHLSVSLPLFDMEVLHIGNDVSVRLHDTWDLGPAKSFIAKVYMGSIYAVSSAICREMRFDCQFESDKSRAEWEGLAPNTEWTFNSKYNQVTFPRLRQVEHRQTESPEKRKVVYSLAQNQHIAKSKELGLNDDKYGHYAAKVREHILKAPGHTSIERSAERLSMSSRYLRQQLAEENTSFREISNDVRLGYADLYLRETPMPLCEIANKLGFGDQASFTRAYRSWTGKTPGETRKASKLS
ncbi:AraC family transcriptional regulator [Alkalimarinus alittae]|uniref:AraC family transcriptional regulator n=1 Tax=Alkalimarinus alittae TaxID=2961619 RepID=A0ABY6MZR3_9ALTE|nr:AraC family transcriptional regulator [Alkalimarinus alittae]UZE95333.1 AraC family transcriptional regulator [Alkalimarinus alittae]